MCTGEKTNHHSDPDGESLVDLLQTFNRNYEFSINS